MAGRLRRALVLLAPGVTSFVVLPALKPGEYRFTDEFRPKSGGLAIVAK
jgi:hypothetical protein